MDALVGSPRVTESAAVLVRQLTKRFPVRREWGEIVREPFGRRWKTALDGVTFEVRQGQVFGLMGTNGAGKTTLLKILGTLLVPTAGTAIVAGYDVAQSPARVRQTLGYCVDTERSFYYRLTGFENLRFFATLNNLRASQAATRVADVLDVVGLNGAAGAAFMTYSKGMQQRLGLARALLTDPMVLLLDEPTRSLDPGAAAEFRRFLRCTLAEQLGKTIVLVTHSPEEARECCDRVALMDRGRIAARGSWSEVEGALREHWLSGHAEAGRP